MPTIEERFVFVPFEEAIVPPEGMIEHFKDRYWMIHPEKGLVFFGKIMAPQCNRSEEIMKRFASPYEWAQVRLIPSAFRRIKISDFCD